MKLAILFLGLCLFVAVACDKCYVKKNVTSPYKWQPNQVNGPMPDNWSWSNVNNTNFLCTTKNQHIPQYCGSCWAQAATSTISDRIAIMRGGKFPEIDISPQVLLTCDMEDDGCHGGDPINAFKWIHDHNITDSSCAPYLANSHYEGLKCDAMAYCKDCSPNGNCVVPPTFNWYSVGEYGELPNDPAAIQNEILARGPVVCGVDAGPIVNWTGPGVLATDQGRSIGHAIAVVGWGVTEDKVPYWLVRNSWGEYWAELGYMKVYRGNNTILIEESCSYAVPVNTWQNQSYPHTSKVGVAPKRKAGLVNTVKEFYQKFISPKIRTKHQNCLIPVEKPTEVITGQQPKDMPMALPESHWWGDVDGVNYLSWIVNQHIPQYCGSCWAQSASSAFADRINIKSGMKFPRTTLAVQVLINCNGGGSCNGGSLVGPYEFAHKHGIPDMGCQVYQAANPARQSCSPDQICKNCKWGANFTQQCWPITTYPKWFASQYGSVTGPDAMKKELFARGPLACGMMVTNKFEQYTGGIYSEKSFIPQQNHAVSVVGWGLDKPTNTEYWIVRNSWGTHFGENGFFRIKMHKENLGLDSNACYWAVPSSSQSADDAELAFQ